MKDNDPEMIILLELDRIEEVIEFPGLRLLASIPDEAEAVSSLQRRSPTSPLFNSSLDTKVVTSYLRQWQAGFWTKPADVPCWSQEPPLGPFSWPSRANADSRAFHTTPLYHAVYQLHSELRYRGGDIEKGDTQLMIVAHQSLNQVLNKLNNKFPANPLFHFGVPPLGSLAHEELRKWHQSIVHKYRPLPTPAPIEEDGMLIPSGGWLALPGDRDGNACNPHRLAIASVVRFGTTKSGQPSRVNIEPASDHHDTLSGVYRPDTFPTRQRRSEGEAFSIAHGPPRPEIAVNPEDDTDSSHTIGRSPDSLLSASYQQYGTPPNIYRPNASSIPQSLLQSRNDQLLSAFFERQDAADERLGVSAQQAVRINVFKDKHLQGDGQLYGAQPGVAEDKALTRLQSVAPTDRRSTEDLYQDAKMYAAKDQELLRGDDKRMHRVEWEPRPHFDELSEFADDEDNEKDKEDPVEQKRIRHLIRRMSWERNADLESSSEFDSSTEFEEVNRCESEEYEYEEYDVSFSEP